ncbi:MAG: anaerobic ribonucleoside-triphosphate reductase activating protein [Acetatifactor sp.]|nr:anaerobic ribonucleoside-triphosphate reductase activating protein [Acetatifactor sp.]
MRYHNITKDDMRNGDGLRVVLWVAGCNHCCKECHNPITWDPAGGLPFDEEAKKEIFEQLDKDYVSGITLSGGDPLYSGNRPDVRALCAELREKYPNKTIWLYTGDSWESIKDDPVMEYVDVVVDGEFHPEEKDVKLLWKGSKNQRVINVRKTLASEDPNIPVIHCPDYYI